MYLFFNLEMDYQTIKNENYQHEIVIEKSRFIALAFRVETNQAAGKIIKDVHKKFPDATHYCYAYLIDDAQKFFDDGEPQGTAGMPILTVIKANNLHNVMVVVVRYFGGIKLGTGGLARAYGRAATEVLNLADKINMKHSIEIMIKVNYSQSVLVEQIVQQFGKVISKDYDTDITYHIAIPVANEEQFITSLQDVLHGELKILSRKQTMIEYL